jgi:hypothetical protein
MTERLNSTDYERVFPRDSEKRKEAHRLALEIRKFEIDLYWRRATYFWTLIGASLVAYAGAQALKDPAVSRDLSVFVSCFGLVVSFAWYCANRGSKQWQENWENHVDLLEDELTGPLYKATWSRPTPKSFVGLLVLTLTGPGPFSVSKINQLVSVYATLLWVGLAFHSLGPFSPAASIRWDYVLATATSLATVWAIWVLGRTHESDHSNIVSMRKSGIEEPSSDSPPPTAP